MTWHRNIPVGPNFYLFFFLLEVVTVLWLVGKNCRVCGRYSAASYDIINLNSPKMQGID